MSFVNGFFPHCDLEVVIQYLISSHLDYCNRLYVCVSQSAPYGLQLVQNTAATLCTGTKKRDHISPVLASLNWLPLIFRIRFKNLLFLFKALDDLATSHIAYIAPV